MPPSLCFAPSAFPLNRRAAPSSGRRAVAAVARTVCSLPSPGEVTPAFARAYLRKHRDSAADAERLDALLSSGAATPHEAVMLLAARLGDVETVRDAVAQGCDVNAADVEGSTAGMRAASRGHSEVLKVLLETGKVNVSQENNWGYNLAIYVGSVKTSLPSQYQEMLSLLAKYMDDPAEQAEKRWTQAPKRKE